MNLVEFFKKYFDFFLKLCVVDCGIGVDEYIKYCGVGDGVLSRRKLLFKVNKNIFLEFKYIIEYIFKIFCGCVVMRVCVVFGSCFVMVFVWF